jgi:Ankyrin repeats (3 copies)
MPTYHLTFKTTNWNRLWATPSEMRIAWRAIKQGEVVRLRESLKQNPKIVRWEETDFFHLFGSSKLPTAELLDCIISGIGSIEDYESWHSRHRYPSVLLPTASLRAAELLIARGANVNAGAGFTSTPLSEAVDHGRLDLVKLYLKHGADPSFKAPTQKTPLQEAIDLGHEDIVKALRRVSAPLDGPPCKLWTSKPDSSITLHLDDQTKFIRNTIKSAVDRWIAAGNKPVGSIVMHTSGVRGFVNVGISESCIAPYAPDCCADVNPLAESTIASWIDAHKNFQEVVAVDGKEMKSTELSLFGKRDKPFYDYVAGQFHAAIKAGVFDRLRTNTQTIYGIQSYYFHHCDCWDYRGTKIRVPREWSRLGERKKEVVKAKGKSQQREAPKAPSLECTISKTASNVVDAGADVGWVFRNGTSLWRLLPGNKQPQQRIAIPYSCVGICLDEQAKYLLTGCGEGLCCIDLEAWKVLDTIGSKHELGELQSMGPRAWLLHSSDTLVLFELNARNKLQSRCIDMPEDLDGCGPEVAYQQRSETLAIAAGATVYVGSIEKTRINLVRSFDLRPDVSVIFNCAFSPSSNHILIDFEDHGEERGLLLLDSKSGDVVARTQLGKVDLVDDLCYCRDGSLLTTKISRSADRMQNHPWPQDDTLVVFDGQTLEYRAHLPVEDIACYNWSASGSQLLVGGYTESTLWKLDNVTHQPVCK